MYSRLIENLTRRMSIFGLSKESRDRSYRDSNNTTMILIVVIAVFLAVELPLSCITALHTISSRYSLKLNSQSVIKTNPSSMNNF